MVRQAASIRVLAWGTQEAWQALRQQAFEEALEGLNHFGRPGVVDMAPTPRGRRAPGGRGCVARPGNGLGVAEDTRNVAPRLPVAPRPLADRCPHQGAPCPAEGAPAGDAATGSGGGWDYGMPSCQRARLVFQLGTAAAIDTSAELFGAGRQPENFPELVVATDNLASILSSDLPPPRAYQSNATPTSLQQWPLRLRHCNSTATL